uniref:translation initiation factor 3 n=1 Tax=Rhodella violacea TaxID=2801 RepID=UPI001FCE16FB|nr:translation initiation factor 3 [Rhodella violacea]UNJ18068.1 translation initiation factor 3 [Rhodella violacea]
MFDKLQFIKLSTRDLPLINEKIRFPQVRVINSEGEQLGVLVIKEAIQTAFQEGLDLVLVSNKSDPPVCRIVDYGKYKFEQEKKAREAKKKQHQITVKEVKMRYKIDEHDYNVRINQASKFLKSGDKVKATITFKGREIQYGDLALNLLQKMSQDLKELSDIQQAPSRDGRNMIMILSPKK